MYKLTPTINKEDDIERDYLESKESIIEDVTDILRYHLSEHLSKEWDDDFLAILVEKFIYQVECIPHSGFNNPHIIIEDTATNFDDVNLTLNSISSDYGEIE